jgi:hypothetical protein
MKTMRHTHQHFEARTWLAIGVVAVLLVLFVLRRLVM